MSDVGDIYDRARKAYYRLESWLTLTAGGSIHISGDVSTVRHHDKVVEVALPESNWVKLLQDTYKAILSFNIPDTPKLDPEFREKGSGGCPECGGELKRAQLFLTIEERCNCGFWRPVNSLLGESIEKAN